MSRAIAVSLAVYKSAPWAAPFAEPRPLPYSSSNMRTGFSVFVALSLAFSSCSAQDAGTSTLPILKAPLTARALQNTISSKNLLSHAEQFLKFSKLSNGTRAFGSQGHEATIHYVKRLLERTGYYDVEFQTFTYPYSDSRSQLTVDGESIPTQSFTYAPGGDVTGPVGLVSNDGCLVVRHSIMIPGALLI